MADDDKPSAEPRGVPGDLRDEERIHPSRLDDTGKMLVFKQWFKDDSRHSGKWRDNAKTNFNFIAGDQWDAKDKEKLTNEMRPCIVFNKALTLLKCVSGMEINSRHEINFIPRSTEDTAVNELLTGASKWMADECDGENEESTAFQHANITGMGWLEHRLSFDVDPQGKYVEEAIDPLEMFWDCRAKKPNLVDSRRFWRVRKVPIGDAMELFPEHSRDELDAVWAKSDAPEEAEKTLEQRRQRDENASAWSDKDEVTLVAIQWFEKEPYWRIADPTTNATAELSTEQYETLTKRMKTIGLPALPAVQMHRKVYHQAFLGNVPLKCGKAPVPDHFSWTPVTGELHHTKGTFFGLVDVMRDPQMWSNKWLSQSLHILNSTAKGGILAEKDAFEDQTQAEESYAQPAAITWMNKGSLSGPNPKVMPKPGGAFPQGHLELMQVAEKALRDVTGINYEMVGLEDQNQPGILAAQRKQAGMTVLATMFDSLRRTRKEIGQIRLYYIQNFLSDGRLVRIVGQDGAKAIPLLKDKTLGTYDVVVDDAPTSPNQKEANWQIILQMLPAFKDKLMERPELLLTVLEYSPLPQRLVDTLKASLSAPNEAAAKAAQLAEQRQVAIIAKDMTAADLNKAKASASGAEALFDIAWARKAMAEADGNEGDSLQSALDAEHKAAQIRTEAAKEENVRADTRGKQVGTVIEALQPIPNHRDAFPPPARKVS